MVTTQQNQLLKDKRVLQYPMGLGSSPTDRHGSDSQFMMFQIRSDEKASTLRSDKSIGAAVVTNSRTGIGTETTLIDSKTKSTLFNQASLAKNADPSLRVLYGDTAVYSENWRTQKGMTRLDKVVILPMPNEHSVGTSIRYNNNYDPSALTKAGDIVNQMGGGAMGELQTLGKNAGISALVNKLAGGRNITSTADLLAEERLALNPKKEVMFDSFGYREFSFRYQFAPKSEAESNMVREIIETFRYYALPEISKAKFFYLLPAEFDISFILGEKLNPNIPKITTSVLQRVGVNYSPNSGVWATLPNGAPLAIDMTLDFLELELVDRNRVYNKDSVITSGY
jgi:hypothetical protein